MCLALAPPPPGKRLATIRLMIAFLRMRLWSASSLSMPCALYSSTSSTPSLRAREMSSFESRHLSSPESVSSVLFPACARLAMTSPMITSLVLRTKSSKTWKPSSLSLPALHSPSALLHAFGLAAAIGVISVGATLG